MPHAAVKTLKNVRMQGARERAAQRTSVGERQSDAGNAADGRFLSVFLFGAAGEFA
jgi:hypothetical protein